MKKSELIKENQRLEVNNKLLKQEINELNNKLSKYEKAIESLRSFYGAKLAELEAERISKIHPDLMVEDIEWDPSDIERFLNTSIHSYEFKYGIKGEINYHEISQF